MNASYQFENALVDSVALVSSTVQIELPEPALIPREVTLRKPLTPNSPASSRYSASELAAAAEMLQKLNRREDITNLLDEQQLPSSYGAAEILDVVVNRLMLVCDATPATVDATVTPKVPMLKLRR